MRKEVLFAVMAGALLGLVIAFGVWRANVAFIPNNNDNKPAETPKPQNSSELSIIKPESMRVLTEDSTIVSGIASANSKVVVVTDEDEYITDADNKGSFEIEVELIGGLNEIKVFGFDKEGQAKQNTILVVYSTEFSKFLETEDKTEKTSSDSAETKSASDSVRQKVAEKIEMVEKSPTAYMGAITDITDTNIQIKDDEGEIQQISINKDDTEFVKTFPTSKTVGFQDLAIGDYVLALGLKNGNKVLDGKRILVIEAFKSNSRVATFGVVSAGKDKKNLNLDTTDQKKFTISFGKTWEGPELTEIEEGDKLIVIGELKDSTITVSTVEKI